MNGKAIEASAPTVASLSADLLAIVPDSAIVHFIRGDGNGIVIAARGGDLVFALGLFLARLQAQASSSGEVKL